MKSTHSKILLVGLSALFASSFVGCSSRASRFGETSSKQGVAANNDSKGSLARSKAKSTNPEQLAPGYSIGLTSLDDRKLNGKFRIRFDGGLSLPYNVSIGKADRMTLTELRQTIREKYRPFFTDAFQIEVTLAERRVWLDVRGLVQKPGKQLVAPEAGLDELIALAGGLQPNSQASEVFIKRADGSEDSYGLARVFEMSGGLGEWSGGETVFLRPEEGTGQFRNADLESRAIQVLGEVRKPGLVIFRSNEDFLYYLTRAEGPTALADMENIEVVRGGVPNAQAIRVKWSEINTLPSLQPGDIVVLRAREPSWWTEKALPIITTVSSFLGTILLAVVVF